MELQQGTVSIKFELRAKNHSWNGPLDKWVILWGLSINRTWSIPGNIPIMYLDHGKAKLLKYMLSIMIMFYWKKKKFLPKLTFLTIVMQGLSKCLIPASKLTRGLVMAYGENMVNDGSGNDLLPDGTQPLPEPMLTNHPWGLMAFI